MPTLSSLRRELAALKTGFAEVVALSLPADERPLNVLVIGQAIPGDPSTPPGVHGGTYFYTGEEPDPGIMTKVNRRLAPGALVIELGAERSADADHRGKRIRRHLKGITEPRTAKLKGGFTQLTTHGRFTRTTTSRFLPPVRGRSPQSDPPGFTVRRGADNARSVGADSGPGAAKCGRAATFPDNLSEVWALSGKTLRRPAVVLRQPRRLAGVRDGPAERTNLEPIAGQTVWILFGAACPTLYTSITTDFATHPPRRSYPRRSCSTPAPAS